MEPTISYLYLYSLVLVSLCHKQKSGVEISQIAVKHSNDCIAKWKSTSQPIRTHMIEIIHGNGLQIDPKTGEGRIGFDRIYVGASIEKSDLGKFTQLLRPGGILLAPGKQVINELVIIFSFHIIYFTHLIHFLYPISVDDELVKIARVPPIMNSKATSEITSSEDSSSQFIHQTISGVRFASLLQSPSMNTCIPAKIWSPQNHRIYPKSFHRASKEIILCSRAKYLQIHNPSPPVNLAAKLPVDVWTHVFSFTDRTCK